MEEQYPMVPVPQALRTVLQQTAIDMLQRQESSPMICDEMSLSSPSDIIGRTSSETIHAPKGGYPPYHASIMDGYAINLNDCQLDTQSENKLMKNFQIVNRVYAGKLEDKDSSTIKRSMNTLTQNDNLPKAVYVTTGSVIPYPDFNVVIPIEDINENISSKIIAIDVNVLQAVKTNQWIRNVGCDIPPNSIILEKGCTIEPVHIGLLLQCGITVVKVQPLPVVGILSTGNEIMSVDEMERNHYLTNGHLDHQGLIPDANGPVLTSLLSSYKSCRVVNYGIANDDDIEGLTRVIQRAIRECNVVITSGGVSMGEKDLIERVLHDRIGCQIHFGRLHMKPGKPTTFATIDKHSPQGIRTKCLIFAMPGNPVSAYVCTELLVRPCLDMLHRASAPNNDNQHSKFNDKILAMVQNAYVHAEVYATLTNRVKLDSERPEYVRVTLSTTLVHYSDGQTTVKFEASSTGVQQSSRMMSMCNADGLMLMPQDTHGTKRFAEAGETYPVLLLRKPGGFTINSCLFNSIKLQDSVHFQNSSLTMGIVEVQGNNMIAEEDDEEISGFHFNNLTIKDKIQNVIDTSMAILQDIQISAEESVIDAIRTQMSDCLDIILVVCKKTTFPQNLKISEELHSCITKDASSLSFQVRKSAASENSLSALFEPVAGYCELGNKSCMLLSVQYEGMEIALDSVKALLRFGAQARKTNRL